MNLPEENPRPRFRAQPWVRMGGYLVAGYMGLVLMLLFLENWLVYPATPATREWWTAPPNSGIEDVTLTIADGTRIHAWWCPKPDSDQALLYCHGNAGNLSYRGGSVVKLAKLLNASVLIFDYPGYGKSAGQPSEQGCYQSADAAYAFLTDEKKIAPKKILFYGGSLGGGVAIDLARRKDHRALVLMKTFTSLPDVAADLYWWLPAPKRLLMTNRFDSIGKIKQCHRPVFIAHGTADTLIPYAHGVRLHDAANEPKQFLSLSGAGHNDPLPEQFFTALNTFLRCHPVE